MTCHCTKNEITIVSELYVGNYRCARFMFLPILLVGQQSYVGATWLVMGLFELKFSKYPIIKILGIFRLSGNHPNGMIRIIVTAYYTAKLMSDCGYSEFRFRFIVQFEHRDSLAYISNTNDKRRCKMQQKFIRSNLPL